ncbi:ABC multidrug transporter [Talaromyces proteolyticus]|uniref:ABC multidrug transporter n=1 Tax=Talaromyces proteolyticus TaxID=1131652 RepID=A0AAD4PV51_9EURO|nr:ABC multidrug transporter [Talaromyces proteolyticus]KAH8696125.1 ABC multidrug transporter [Talaromyces proteolyticus]
MATDKPDSCPSNADNVFGPLIISSCRGGLDFTLLFEEAILSMIPAAAFLIGATFQGLYLIRQQKKTVPCSSERVLKYSKIVITLSLTALQLISLLSWSSSKNFPTQLSALAALLSLISFLALTVLSAIQHDRGVNPSTLISVYLLVSISCDMPQLRTLWMRHGYGLVFLVRTASLVLKTLSLGLESMNKSDYLKSAYQNLSPEALGGLISRSLFWWLNPILYHGYKNILEIEQLPPLDVKLSAVRLQADLVNFWSSWPKSGSHPLLFATLTCFRRPLLEVIPPRIFSIACKFLQPVLIRKAVSLMGEPESREKQVKGLVLIGLAAFLYIGIAVGTATYKHKIYRSLVTIRGGLIGLIYNATLSLDTFVARDTVAITLMTADVDRIMAGIEMLDVVWATPIEVTLAVLMLIQQVGWACLAPLFISMACTCATIYVGKLATNAQKTWLDSIQQRVSATAALLVNMKPIKMTGLIEPLAMDLQNRRINEIKVSKSYRKVDAAQQAIGNTSLVITPVVTFLAYVVQSHAANNGPLDSKTAFTSLSLIALLSYPIVYFVFAVPRFTGSIGCYDRIQAYVCDTAQDTRLTKFSSKDSHQPETNIEGPISDVVSEDETENIELESLLPKNDAHNQSEYSWPDNPNRQENSSKLPNPTDGTSLVQIEHMNFYYGDKTQVLRDITITITKGELVLLTGPVGSGKTSLLLALLGELNGRNGLEYRQSSLSIGFCAQEPWVPNFSIRDIIVGISSFNDLWFTQVVSICALDKDISCLPDKEHTVVGSNGASLSGGQKQRLCLARALYSRKELLFLDDVFSGLDVPTEQAIIHNVFGQNGFCKTYGITVALATHAVKYYQYFDRKFVLQLGGTISEEKSDKDIAFNSEDNTSVESDVLLDSLTTNNNVSMKPNQSQPTKSSEMRHGDLSLYVYYFKMMGWGITALIISSSATFVFCYKFPDIWLKWWTESESQSPGKHTKMYLFIYGILPIIAIPALMVFEWSLKIVAVPRTASKLHKTLLSTVVMAPYNFFVSIDPGNILNYFSEDLSIIDMQLTLALAKVIDGVFTVIAETILIAFASAWTTLLFPPLVGVLYILQKFYLRTSQQMRLLEIEGRAPLHSHFLETLQGLTTIRAFAWQYQWDERQRYLLDQSQKPLYIMYCIQRWLNLILDLIVASFGVVVMSLATQLPRSSTEGAIGVSLVNILTFSATLTYMIQAWAQLETSKGAVQRIRDFADRTASEHQLAENQRPPPGWISKGFVSFEGLSASYSMGSDPVLRDVTVRISAGQKVGICGRTGRQVQYNVYYNKSKLREHSGKSTMLLSILRLTEVLSGSISIDNFDLSRIPRDMIRKSITVIPQDPVIFHGSIRFNLDPEYKHSDESIRQILRRVGLQETAGADFEADMMQSTSAALSRGELQLFCLARALLQHGDSRLVVMDEISANVDTKTEEQIMQIVKETFTDATVIAVAHRLKTIRDSDLILVMDEGRLVEAGNTNNLLNDPNSRFTQLWNSMETTGS